jgi:hypothetical protein
MIPDHDLFLAQAEVNRRRKLADVERLAQSARCVIPLETSLPDLPFRPSFQNALVWFRRLIGLRHV